MSDEPVWVPLQVTSGVRSIECRSETYTQIKFQGEEKSVTLDRKPAKPCVIPQHLVFGVEIRNDGWKSKVT